MTLQFGRKYRLVIAGLLIEHLDIKFRAVRTGTLVPNTLELTVLNLKSERREALHEKEELTVQLEAGYNDNFGTVFLGDVRQVSSEFQSPDWKTNIAGGDGERSFQESRINKSFAAGTDLTTVLKEAGEALVGIGTGNLAKSVLKGKLPNGAKAFVNGVTLSGAAVREFDKICKSAGLQWSIQDKKLQVLKANETLVSEAVFLTPDSGLIGSPTLASDGILRYTALLNPNIVPGRQLSVESRHVSGRFKAGKCEYVGSTSSKSWYVKGEAKELKVDNGNA